MKRLVLLLLVCGATTTGSAQVIIPPFQASELGNGTIAYRPRIAAAADGSFAVAWEDLRDETHRIAVRRFSPEGNLLGSTYLFQAESGGIPTWYNDFLERAELLYQPDGYLLVLMEHEGSRSGVLGDYRDSQVVMGAIAPDGQVFDFDKGTPEAIQLKLHFENYERHQRPRMAVGPDGTVAIAADARALARSDRVNFTEALVKFLDPSLRQYEGVQVLSGPSGQQGVFNDNINVDVAYSGNALIIVWMSAPADANGNYLGSYDIHLQAYTSNGQGGLQAAGGTQRVNDADDGSIGNEYPAIAMNASGISVVAWLDYRAGSAVFAQRYNAQGQPVGGNFRVSEPAAGAEIRSVPEVAMRSDGSFMIVWADSNLSVNGTFRARARQYDAAGQPLGPPFMLVDAFSGFPSVATDGSAYYAVWAEVREGKLHAVASKMGGARTGAEPEPPRDDVALAFHPNPFRGTGTLRYTLERPGHVSLVVSDVLGREVARLVDRPEAAGSHTLPLNGVSWPAGIYVVVLRAGGTAMSHTIVKVD